MAEDAEPRTETKRIRLTVGEARRLSDAYHEWAKGKADDEWALFVMWLLDRAAAPPVRGPAGRAPGVLDVLGAGREDPRWEDRVGGRRA